MQLSKNIERISVVLPVYSETDSVRQVVDWLMATLGGKLLEIIIVASPKSSPESRQVCEALTVRYPQVRLESQRVNPGLGNAVRQGLARTRGDWVLMMDSDGEMENETVLRMIDKLAEDDYQLVVASRWIRGGGFSGYGGFKYYLNWAFQQIFRIIFWTGLHDLTYGFKLLRGDLARDIEWEGTLHEIACETTLKPVRLGVPVAEVPSRWTARTQGVSKNSFLRNFRYVRTALAARSRQKAGGSRPYAGQAELSRINFAATKSFPT
jgi:dolichol-phosphate mannosyltransferase